MVSSPCPCCDAHILKFVRLCVRPMMWLLLPIYRYTPHSTTQITQWQHTAKYNTPRKAGLNEREAPGKVVTARPPTRLAQVRSAVFHNFFLPQHPLLWLKLTPTCWNMNNHLWRKSTPPPLQAELKKITVWTVRNAAMKCCRKLYVCMKLLTVFIVDCYCDYGVKATIN